MNLYKITFLLLTTMLIFSCGEREIPDVSNIDIEVEAIRFDQILFDSDSADFYDEMQLFRSLDEPQLMETYIENVLAIGKINEDSIWIPILKDFVYNPSLQGLYDTCQSKYHNNFTDIEEELTQAFKYLRHYYPMIPTPKIFTMISEFGYGVAYKEDQLLIGLDMYLGKKYKYYPSLGFPIYLIRRLEREYIVPNAMMSIANEVTFPQTGSFLAEAITEGKKLYFLKSILPYTADTLITGFTGLQQKWVEENESDIYSFFVSEEILFSTQNRSYFKYLTDGPNSQGMPKDSPAKTGIWLGYKVVKSYMEEHPEVTLSELMSMKIEPQDFLRKSKYRP